MTKNIVLLLPEFPFPVPLPLCASSVTCIYVTWTKGQPELLVPRGGYHYYVPYIPGKYDKYRYENHTESLLDPKVLLISYSYTRQIREVPMSETLKSRRSMLKGRDQSIYVAFNSTPHPLLHSTKTPGGRVVIDTTFFCVSCCPRFDY